MCDNNKQLGEDSVLALNCFLTAVVQGSDNGAARFREELHMILDLQLDNVIKQGKKNGQ